MENAVIPNMVDSIDEPIKAMDAWSDPEAFIVEVLAVANRQAKRDGELKREVTRADLTTALVLHVSMEAGRPTVDRAPEYSKDQQVAAVVDAVLDHLGELAAST